MTARHETADRRADTSRLGSTPGPLSKEYDVAMLDLDGVVYIGADAVPGAAEHLAAAAVDGMSLAYVTNNASRPPRTVAAHLRDLGVPAGDDDVVTSAQAAARLVSEQVQAGDHVFVIGGEGLFEALTELGLQPVQDPDDSPAAVVSGYHPDLRWRTVIDGAILVRQGLPWIASNTDLTVPTPHGPGPGNGVLVRAVAEFAQVEPVVAGKPEPPLFEETVRRVGGDRPLVVGDRLDTDIEGAVRAGHDSLLVMTGVTGLAELVAAGPGSRPTYVSADLEGLVHPHGAPAADGDGWELGGWRAEVTRGRLTLSGDGSPDDWWRVVAVASWHEHDVRGEPVDTDGLQPPEHEVVPSGG
jgi:HAD superfamily hydrolase (TIGR01450 family)